MHVPVREYSYRSSMVLLAVRVTVNLMVSRSIALPTIGSTSNLKQEHDILDYAPLSS